MRTLPRPTRRHFPPPEILTNLGAIYRGQLLKPWAVVLGLWLLMLILTPIGLWTVGPKIFPAVATAGVLAHALVTFLALALKKNIRWLVLTLVIVFGFSWGVEALGVKTGYPFGHYTYTSALQPQLFGVPLLIPFAWFMMIVPAWGMTEILLGGVEVRLGRYYWLVYAGLAGLAMTAWDLYLDPQMVSQNLWQWDVVGGYFGIPWLNFFGWWLTAFVLTLFVRPRDLPVHPLALIYGLTWIFQAIGLGIFWSQPGPALAGFFGMGVFVIIGWVQEVRQWGG